MCSCFKVLNETFDKYFLSQVFLSFNGGKDCTVLLHMVDTVMGQRVELSDEKLMCLYIRPLEPFEEIEEFVELCKAQYRIHVESPKDGNFSMQTALFGVCEENPELRAVLMGCRRTDPYCEKLGTYEVGRYSTRDREIYFWCHNRRLLLDGRH